MLYYALKVLVSAILIVAISELAKRSSLLGALLASLPITSLLAFIWLYRDTHSVEKVAALSSGIFWLVLPSLVLFVLLPWFLRLGWGFWLSLTLGIGLTALAYWLMSLLLQRLAIQI
ncbi:MAG TPA: DUF3147 family protein [Burkholderiaceae bacterium]|nr:DUF3147 family protein [Burkholderiaceae bacterium]